MFWIFLAVYLLLIFCLGLKCSQWNSETDEQLQTRLSKYSDSTDESYLSQMPSDVSPEVALGVRRIIVDAGGVEVDEFWPQTSLTELLE
jgi:hypothetical protein